MRVVTIQHKDVLDIINRRGAYWVDQSKSQYDSYSETYDVMKELMRTVTGEEVLPIWCFSKVHDIEPSTDINWEYYDGKGANIDENSVLLELEIEESKAVITNYYNWTDYMYYLGERDWGEAICSLGYITDLTQADTIQVCIPYISKDMLIGVYKNGQ